MSWASDKAQEIQATEPDDTTDVDMLERAIRATIEKCARRVHCACGEPCCAVIAAKRRILALLSDDEPKR